MNNSYSVTPFCHGESGAKFCHPSARRIVKKKNFILYFGSSTITNDDPEDYSVFLFCISYFVQPYGLTLPRPKTVSRNQIRKWKSHWNCRFAISSPSELRNCCDCFVTGSFSVAIIKFWVSSSSQNSLFSTCVQQKFWLVVWFRRNIFRLRRLQNSKMYNQVVVSTIELRVIWYPEG